MQDNHTDECPQNFSPEPNCELIKTFKIGILRQLHKRGLMTDGQLRQLIEMQER